MDFDRLLNIVGQAPILIVFAIAAFSATGSVELSKNLRHLIWTVVIWR